MPSFSLRGRHFVNSSSRNVLFLLGAVVTICLLPLTGCGSISKQLVFERTIALPSGRFAGPIKVQLPRRDLDSHRDVEIDLELRSACTPLLQVTYPDGEMASIGSEDRSWQDLLQKRAEHTATLGRSLEASHESGNNSDEVARSSTQGQLPERGHWRKTLVESWPGQLEFIRYRNQHCGSSTGYRSTYTSAVDQSGLLTIWAAVPQELHDAEITIHVFEVIDQNREESFARAKEARDRRSEARLNLQARITLDGGVAVPSTRSPKPPPKRESPRAAKDPNARWHAGHWQWTSGVGTWKWIQGNWLRPAKMPANKSEIRGAIPLAGCRWHSGHWIWLSSRGSWEWEPGYWNPPPDKVEDRGTPPVAESPWIRGGWQRSELSFHWISGYWGKPRGRSETPPPVPYAGARWQQGIWMQVAGKWIWSPGSYAHSGQTPPPPRNEKPGPVPVVGAVWLGGYWRWSSVKQGFTWTSGHWEHPPGEGYEWIADPSNDRLQRPQSGHWRIRVVLPVRVKVRL